MPRRISARGHEPMTEPFGQKLQPATTAQQPMGCLRRAGPVGRSGTAIQALGSHLAARPKCNEMRISLHVDADFY
jgi:hypothetical protein